MKTVKPEAKRKTEKASSAVPKILTLQEEMRVMKELSLPYFKLMMITKTLTAANVEMLQLQLAAENGFTLVMNLLLTTGEASVNRTDGAGNTALDFAITAGKETMVALLKEYGAVSGQVRASEEPEDLLVTGSGSDADDESSDRDSVPLAGEGDALEEGLV